MGYIFGIDGRGTHRRVSKGATGVCLRLFGDTTCGALAGIVRHFGSNAQSAHA
ncbi:MAG: hypothetical protein ACTSU0_01985 [Alphaproteobacteria bacterium]